jgi:uncharacterized protein GlcG (DUF336 family)
MKWAASLLLAAALRAQSSIVTEMRDGISRADVRHADTGAPVTNVDAAAGDENLALNASGLDADSMLWVGGIQTPFTTTPDGMIAFTMPSGVGGGYVEIAVSGAPAATFPAVDPADDVQLTAGEVRDLANNAALAVDDPGLVVVVVDRAGRPLAVFRRPAAADADVEKALALARAGAFFSNQRTPLSSRTVRAISRPNFPEGIPNQPAGALFGIENTNRGCSLNAIFNPGSAVPPPQNAAGTGPSQGIATTAGGIPLFRNGTIVIGGIGVAGVRHENVAEFATVAATSGTPFFVQLPLPPPEGVYLDGFLLPFVNQTTRPAGVQPASSPGGLFQIGPLAGNPAPEGWLIGPKGGSALSADDVRSIIDSAVARAGRTRAAIRLPYGTRTRMVMSVSDLDGTILGLFRMPDATIFSIDVAATKARNVVYFSGPGRDPQDLAGVPPGIAVTNRTIGFGSQPFFPSGIQNSLPGPFRDLYNFDLANPCTQGRQPNDPNQSGIVFFPGSAPLYRGGRMVGGLGVSGDGVEQDDYVTAGGAQGFEALDSIRADQIFIRNVRLPYWKFPRDPEQ